MSTKLPLGNEFGRGWKVLIASSVGVGAGLSGIVFYTFGVFIAPLMAAFGWTRGQTVVGASMLTIATAISAPIVGSIIDKYGARKTALTSMLLVVAGYGALTQLSGNIAIFYVTWLILALAGGGTTPVIWTRSVGMWFDKKRGLALGLCLAGSGLTGIFGPLYATFLIKNFGWQAGYVGIAAVVLLVGVPVVYLLFRERPLANFNGKALDSDDGVSGLTAREATRTSAFWKLGFAFFLISAVVAALLVNLVPLLTDRGLSAMQAASIASLLGFSVIAGRIGVGFLIDHFSAAGVAFVILLVGAFACIALSMSGWDWAPIFATIAFGLLAATEVDLLAFMSSRHFGMKAYGKIYGFQVSIFYAGGACGPLAIGIAYDRYHGYGEILYFCAGALVFGALTLCTIGKSRYMVEMVSPKRAPISS